MLDDNAGDTGTGLVRNWFAFRWVPNAKQWRGPPIEYTADYCLAVIEFDDQGWYQDIGQRDALERFLNQKANQKEDLLIVAFIHGRKHNAAADDTSLQSFRGVLRDTCLSESHRRRRQVLGVYLSWRGLSLSGNDVWMNASFWTRKKAAAKVAVGVSGKSLLGYALSKQPGTKRTTSKDWMWELALLSRVTPLVA
jgi:hypothetical protein